MYDPGTYLIVSRWIFDQDKGFLDHRERIVLLALARNFNSQLTCFPAYETIAKAAGYSTRSVERIITDQLIPKNVLANEIPEGSDLRSNFYRFLPDLSEHRQSVGHTKNYPDNLSGDTRQTDGHTRQTDGVPRQSVGLTCSTNIREEDIGYTDNLSGIISDTMPLGPEQQEREEQFTALAKKVSFALADTLIDRGLKNPRYRNDALDWLPEIEGLIAFSTGMDLWGELYAVGDWALVEEAYVEMVQKAPDHIDFTVASGAWPPPALMKRKFDELLRPSIIARLPEKPQEPKKELPGTEEPVEALNGLGTLREDEPNSKFSRLREKLAEVAAE